MSYTCIYSFKKINIYLFTFLFMHLFIYYLYLLIYFGLHCSFHFAMHAISAIMTVCHVSETYWPFRRPLCKWPMAGLFRSRRLMAESL